MTSTAWSPTAADLVAALREVYLPEGAIRAGKDEWSFLTEVLSTGSPAHDVGPPRLPSGTSSAEVEAAWEAYRQAQKVRAIDVLLIRNWRSGKVPYERVAVEIKISRSDFRRDTAAKRAPWLAMVHRFAYCVPAGLVAPEEVPSGCWLIEVSEHPCDGTSTGHKHVPTRVHWNRKVKGVWGAPGPLPEPVAVNLAREASRAKEMIRASDPDGDGGGVAGAKVADDLRRARNRVFALEQRERANRDRVAAMLALVAPLLPQDCADCGAPIRPSVPAGYGVAGWKHRDDAAEQACARARLATRAHTFGRFEVEPASVRAERQRAHDEERAAEAERRAYLHTLHRP